MKRQEQVLKIGLEVIAMVHRYDTNTPTPAEDRYGRQLGAVKPLAQYLDEYLDHEAELGNLSYIVYDKDSWRELLEQALDAYELTENVKIRIERV
ncbi:hypothetical protein KAR91_43655 [Candidatus Pacearchaeota archaeon]|nr:hypothetical protein [Candidatus Pacearchaeota archaeon]